jgi:hypothetical protein
MLPDNEDARRLGVAISGLWVDGRPVGLADGALASGWHDPEPGWRWTDGGASLALPDAAELSFEIAMTGTYWQDAPQPRRMTA